MTPTAQPPDCTPAMAHMPAEALAEVATYFQALSEPTRLQILNLLLSTYDAAIQRNKELSRIREALEKSSSELLAANQLMPALLKSGLSKFEVAKSLASFEHSAHQVSLFRPSFQS